MSHARGFLAHSSTTDPEEFLSGFKPERWMDDAACRDSDPDAWFPEPGTRRYATRTALYLCKHVCPVADQCLRFAVQQRRNGLILHGIWGGTTENDRRRIPLPTIERTPPT